MHIQEGDTLGFLMVQTNWKNSRVASSWPPGTSGNRGLKMFFCHFFDQPSTHDGPTAPGRCATASTVMYIQKVKTLGFPTVQMDWKKSMVAPSYPPSTFWQPGFEKTIVAIFLTNLQPMTVRQIQADVRRLARPFIFRK